MNDQRIRETAAGGVVIPRLPPSPPSILIGDQRDRNTGQTTIRLPKGKVDPGESLEEAALREVREETGFDAEILSPLPSHAYVYTEKATGQQVDKRVHFFLMRSLSDQPGDNDDELQDVRWCAIDEALERLSFENEREIVRAARSQLARSQLAQPPPRDDR